MFYKFSEVNLILINNLEMKNIYLLLVVLAICNTLSGQVSVGLAVGNNFSRIKTHIDELNYPVPIDPERNYDNPIKTGLVVGIPLEVNLSSRFSLYTLFSFLQKGSKSGSNQLKNDDIHITQGASTYNYIELPLQAKYYLTKNKLSTHISLGPSLGYLVSAKSNSSYTIVNADNITKFSNHSNWEILHPEIKNSALKHLDVSLTLGGGVEYEMGTGKIFFNANYIHGLTNWIKHHPQATFSYKSFHRGVITSVGYLMPLFK